MAVCMFAEQCMMAISEGEVLEQRLQSMAADSRGELERRGLPTGSPAVLIICAAAMSCVNISKKLPNLNRVRLLLARVTSSCPCSRGRRTGAEVEYLQQHHESDDLALCQTLGEGA